MGYKLTSKKWNEMVFTQSLFPYGCKEDIRPYLHVTHDPFVQDGYTALYRVEFANDNAQKIFYGTYDRAYYLYPSTYEDWTTIREMERTCIISFENPVTAHTNFGSEWAESYCAMIRFPDEEEAISTLIVIHKTQKIL